MDGGSKEARLLVILSKRKYRNGSQSCRYYDTVAHPPGRPWNDRYLSSLRDIFLFGLIKNENTVLFFVFRLWRARAGMFFFFVLARKLSRRKSGGVMFFLCSRAKLSRQKSGGSCRHVKNLRTDQSRLMSELIVPNLGGRHWIGGKKGGAILRAHQQKDLRSFPYFLVIAYYEKAFLYVLSLK